MQPPNVVTQRRVALLKEWSVATRLIIIGIIIQSLLQSLADFFLPEQSKFKILFWAMVLVGASIFFTFIDNFLQCFQNTFVDPVIDKWSVAQLALNCF